MKVDKKKQQQEEYKQLLKIAKKAYFKITKIKGTKLKTGEMESIMIDIRIGLTDFHNVVNSRRFATMYSEMGGYSLSGTIVDTKLGSIMGFSATNHFIHLIPKLKYKPESVVDYFLTVRKKICKSAQLMTYSNYVRRMEDEMKYG